MTHCTDLAAQIAAETDPARKAELQAQYARECPNQPGGQPGGDSGNNSPPPPHP